MSQLVFYQMMEFIHVVYIDIFVAALAPPLQPSRFIRKEWIPIRVHLLFTLHTRGLPLSPWSYKWAIKGIVTGSSFLKVLVKCIGISIE